MRSGPTGAARCVGPWGYLTDPSRAGPGVYLRATLRRFDSKLEARPVLGPLIPCERRLAKREFPEFQEVNSRARSGYRDYDRPFRNILVTLCRFD